jgi:lysozyme
MGTQAIAIAADLCRHFEGLRLKPYICPAGYATVGYGSTFYPNGRRVLITDPPITKEYANEILAYDLEKFLAGVLVQCPVLSGQTRRLAAITDFAFNLGLGRLKASTLRKKINAQDYEGAKEELAKWVRGGGRILPGLVRRRNAEIALL